MRKLISVLKESYMKPHNTKLFLRSQALNQNFEPQEQQGSGSQFGGGPPRGANYPWQNRKKIIFERCFWHASELIIPCSHKILFKRVL